jgi:hypothetical protein
MFVRVKVKATGHQVDIIESHFDPDRHERVKRVAPSSRPRRSKFRVRYQSSASKAVGTPAGSSIEAGTVEKEVEP